MSLLPRFSRRSRRFLPSLGDGPLEPRALLSGASVKAALGRSLPAEPVGSSYDISVPGPKLGSTHEIVVGPDGNFWFTQQLQDRVVRMTYDGKFTFYPTGEGSGPHGIKFDSKGRLWFTREYANTISRMNLDGKIVANYPIPSPDSHPHGLTVARDGKVWFTGREGNLVGYFNPANKSFKLYDLPVRNVNPDPSMNGNFPIYIDEAPDGSMYFTDLLTSRVGRITPDGALTEYPLPSKYGPAGNARPIAVFVRPDGVAVVSEEAGHAYATVMTSGSVQEFPLNPSDAKAAALTYDRLGTLWVQYNTPDQIGRVEADGTVTPFAIPTADAIQHRVIIGPDGELWFTELGKDKIGRMVTGHASGPAIDFVLGQSFLPGKKGFAYDAAFRQGRNVYRASFDLKIHGKGTAADRNAAIFAFRRNLQGRVNRLPASTNKPLYGLQLPPATGSRVHTHFTRNGQELTFVQKEKIGGAVYVSEFRMVISRAKKSSTSPTNLSSAVAHDLEAIKVLTARG